MNKRVCIIDSCEKKAVRKEMCSKHYQRKSAGIRLDDPLPGFRWCRRCNNDKLFNEFWKGRSQCKKCENELTKLKRENDKEYAAKVREWRKITDSKRALPRRLQRLERLYGLKKEDFDKILESQGGGCAICNSTKLLCVDHNHETGQVRGILCMSCNSAIGLLKDSGELLLNAFSYLNKSMPVEVK